MPTIVEAIGKIGLVHENVIPNIVDKMEIAANSNWSSGTEMSLWPFGSAAMKALQRFGPKAMSAYPFLIKFLPTKTGVNRSRLLVITEVTRTIGAMGPAAKAAIPQLQVMTIFRNHPHGDNNKARLDNLHKAAKEAIAAIKK